MDFTFSCLKFDELSNKTLYEILRLRQEIFIVEQNCAYLDADGKDYDGHHVIMYQDEKIIAYTRILEPGISYENFTSIGRVINKKSIRGKGVGKLLMEYSIEKTLEFYPDFSIKISAQTYLHDFYSNLGFKKNGDGYLEDKIPHQAMIYNKNDFEN